MTSLKELKAYEGDERKSVKSVYSWMEKQLIAAINGNGASQVGDSQ